MDLRSIRTIILNTGDANAKREEIRRYFHATYNLDEQLYETLASEAAFYLRPELLRHPLIFYLGHTAVFYVNKLIVAKITDRRINPRFESMFSVGMDEMSWDDLNPANYDWPTLAELKRYRDTVRAVVDETIRTMPLVLPINWDNPFWVILMGIEHQRIHIETSSVTIRCLPIEMVRQLPLWGTCPLAGEVQRVIARAPEELIVTAVAVDGVIRQVIANTGLGQDVVTFTTGINTHDSLLRIFLFLIGVRGGKDVHAR